jgi:hypothetical protein
MQPLINALSTAAAVRKIPPLKEASPGKVMSCALVTSTDLEKDLDAAKEVTGGVVVSFVKMAGQLPWSAGHGLWPSLPPPPLTMRGSPCTRDRGMCLARALSPRLTIGKEHRSVMPTCPTMGILTQRKVTIRCQLVVPSSSSNDDLSLVKHDSRVDLKPSGTRIRYTPLSSRNFTIPQYER